MSLPPAQPSGSPGVRFTAEEHKALLDRLGALERVAALAREEHPEDAPPGECEMCDQLRALDAVPSRGSGEGRMRSVTPDEMEDEINRLWEARWITQDALLRLRLDYESLRKRFARQNRWIAALCVAVLLFGVAALLPEPL